MKRRGFIKSGIATLAAGTASSSVLGEIIAPDGENITSEEMNHFFLKMDTAMDQISSSSGFYIKKLMHQSPDRIDLDHFKSGIRSLLLVGNFGDLSVQGQVHPGMQKRLQYSAYEINSTFLDLKDKLKSMPAISRDEIKLALEEEPELGDRVLESLELEAKAIGVPSRRIKQMRRMGNLIVKRLNHSPDMLINEYVSKCEKLNSIDDSEIDKERFMKKLLGEEEFNIRFLKAEKAALDWQKSEIPDIPIGYRALKTLEDDDKPSGVKKEKRYKKGTRALGVGAILTAAGWLLIGIGQAGAGFLLAIGVGLGVTVGPLIILIALIMLLVIALKKPSDK